MRAATSGQLTVLDSPAFDTYCRVLIADADGTLRDYTSQSGKNWITQAEIEVNIDQPIAQATLQLRRDVIDGTGPLSLSPLISSSTLNRNALNGFASAIDVGRKVQIFTATMASGVSPSSGDWQNIFEGMIDKWQIEHSPIVLTCRDQGGALQDQFIEVEENYGSDFPGTPIETVMQQILDRWMGVGVVTLNCPASPGYGISPYTQSRVAVMDALQTLAGLIGYDLRYRWNSTASQWQLTLLVVPRTGAASTTPVRTIGAGNYIDVQTLQVDRTNIRNAFTVWFTDSATGTRQFATDSDTTSIARYGRLWMETDEPVDSPINSAPTAAAFIGYMKADLKDPLADQTIERHHDWTVELNDVHLYQANNVHYDADQTLAVIAYRHTIGMGKSRTVVAVRGKPCARYLAWRSKRNTPTPTAATAAPSLIVNAVVNADSVSITVQNTGILTLSTDGGLTFSDPGITQYPFLVQRQSQTLYYVFKATLNGSHTSFPVVIPQLVGQTTTVTPPPDTAYAPVVSIPSVQNVHAQHAGLISLTAMPSARTEFDQNCRFKFDVTNVGQILIGVNVNTPGASGSKIAIEYLDPNTVIWNLVGTGGTDIAAPIDSVGLQEAVGAIVSGLTGRVEFRVVTVGGDGVTTPQIGNVYIEFQPLTSDATVANARVGILYLRDLIPLTSPPASQFPMSGVLPLHTVDLPPTWSAKTPSAGIVRSLLATKGSDNSTPGTHLTYTETAIWEYEDKFPGAFVSAQFTQAQAVPGGNWEFGAVVHKHAQSDMQLYAKPVIYLMRLVAGTWTKVATIYDAHGPDTTGQPGILGSAWLYGGNMVIKYVVPGLSFVAQVGDVIVLEPWAHKDKADTGYIGPTDDGSTSFADLYFDGPNDLPLSSVDGSTWGTAVPASYLKPVVPLAIGTAASGGQATYCSILTSGFWRTDFTEFDNDAAFQAAMTTYFNTDFPPGTLFFDFGYPNKNFCYIDENEQFCGHHTLHGKVGNTPLADGFFFGEAGGFDGNNGATINYLDLWTRFRWKFSTAYSTAAIAMPFLAFNMAAFVLVGIENNDNHGSWAQLFLQNGRLWLNLNGGQNTDPLPQNILMDLGPETQIVNGTWMECIMRRSPATGMAGITNGFAIRVWYGPVGGPYTEVSGAVSTADLGPGVYDIAGGNDTSYNPPKSDFWCGSVEVANGALAADPFSVLKVRGAIVTGKATATASIGFLHNQHHLQVATAAGQATATATISKAGWHYLTASAAGHATATATRGPMQRHLTSPATFETPSGPVSPVGFAIVTATINAKRHPTTAAAGHATVTANIGRLRHFTAAAHGAAGVTGNLT